MTEAARVLHVVGRMTRGGAETMIMNIYRCVDRTRLQFDFLCTSPEEQSYDHEIRQLGGHIIHVDAPAKVGHHRYLWQVRQALRASGPFRAVHAHTLFNTGLIVALAKYTGIPVRVCHSHSTDDIVNASLKGKLYHLAMRPLILHYATQLVACGRDAGQYLFGKHAYETRDIHILPNALDLSVYASLNREDVKKKYNKEFGFNDTDIILGHVASFQPLKNQSFLITLIQELQENYKLILVGDGATRSEVERLVEAHHLNKKVIFTGMRTDIPELMTYFDVFLLPSFYEGIPVTVVEAQAAGTTCVVSDTVSSEVNLGLDLIQYVSLDQFDLWIAAVTRAASVHNKAPFPERSRAFQAHNYDVQSNVHALYTIYGV